MDNISKLKETVFGLGVSPLFSLALLFYKVPAETSIVLLHEPCQIFLWSEKSNTSPNQINWIFNVLSGSL